MAYGDDEYQRIRNRDNENAIKRLTEALSASEAEVARLTALINNPHTNNFLDAVRLEAAHQRERWKAEHDAGKTDADWLWLIGHLVGKAIHKPEKQLHHIITTAAACLNWHMHGAHRRQRYASGNCGADGVSESLPGYDAWKTHDPRDDEPEDERDSDDARDQAIESKRLDRIFGDAEDEDICF